MLEKAKDKVCIELSIDFQLRVHVLQMIMGQYQFYFQPVLCTSINITAVRALKVAN